VSDFALIRFADYELDPAARTLIQGGRQIVLGPKTFDLLKFLVEHPHRVIYKEELLRALWPEAFVDESNLAQHVFLLRKALATSGSLARAIVTVPGKGYQFTAQVSQVSREAAMRPGSGLVLHAVQSITRVVVEEETEAEDQAPVPQALAAPQRRRRRAAWMAVAVAVFVLVGLGSILVWRQLRPSPAGHIDFVLSALENTTGDPAFDNTLNQALQIDLVQSPFLNLLSRSKIQESLAQMQRRKDEPLTPSLALEICERNNAQAMLHGSISQLGKTYLLILDATSCVTGKQIAGYRGEASSKEDVLNVLDKAVGQVRKQLGESVESLERFQTPIMQATTPSLDALRAYSQGIERFNQGDMKGAQVLLEHAIALDPNFASAYKTLSSAYYNRYDFAQAALYSKKAFDLRDRTSERERLSIEIHYYAKWALDSEAAIRSMKLFNEIYPNDSQNWANLANTYTQLGEYPQAIDAGEHAFRIDPHAAVVAQVLARAYKRANRFADAKRVANAAVEEGKEEWGLHSILFQIAYSEHDGAKIKSEIDWGLQHQSANDALDDLGDAMATGGQYRAAMDNFTRSRTEALRGGDADFANELLLEVARIQIDLDEPAQAAATLKQLKGDGGSMATLVTFKANLGDIGPAQRFLATTGAASDTKDTTLLYSDLPYLRATLALKAHKPADAVNLLEPARAYQLRDYEIPYLRAEAEAEAGLLDAAVEDYRLILDNPGVDPISPEYSLSHLRLARVLARQKKTDESRTEYRAFLDAWKNADSGLPPFEDARRELAQLH
jgi:DNA-binding winged helix-turn-helix (wHTH) protein/tetratricopeptide (TPR) repeat protein